MEYVRLKELDIVNSVGERLYIIFRAHDITVKKQSNQGKFMRLNMVDSEVRQGAIIFSVTEKMIQEIVEGKVYAAIVDVKPYRESFSCVIDDIGLYDIDPEEFNIKPRDNSEFAEMIRNAMAIIDGSVYGTIANKILMEKWDKFKIWTAAKGQHHSELGELLIHTAEVTKIAIQAAQTLNDIYGEDFINLKLLIASCLLHDVGKVEELSIDTTSGEVSYSDDSALSSHITQCLEYIDIAAISEGLIGNKEVKLLKHAVAAHHGRLDWGSPVEPAIPEAFLLHHVDMISANMYKFDRELTGVVEGKCKTVWNGGKIDKYYKG